MDKETIENLSSFDYSDAVGCNPIMGLRHTIPVCAALFSGSCHDHLRLALHVGKFIST